MEIIEVTKVREYELRVSGNHSSVKNLVHQTTIDMTKTNKNTSVNV